MRTSLGLGMITIFGLLALSNFAFGASARDVVINEIWVNDPHNYDSGEYIELYNRTASPISLAKWVLDGTEYDGVCGEHHWQMPSGISIPAHGYIVIARDSKSNDEVNNPGFTSTWGFKPDVEMYDPLMYFEVDDATVPNMVVQNPDVGTPHDTQIRLIPGVSDYAMSCSGSYDHYEALWLYADSARTQLIDAMEYRDPLYCAADACPGVGTSNNDAFIGIPAPGVSLGRDQSSTDTDNSGVDFHFEVATPKAQNINNMPPDIWTLRYSPCAPTASNTVTISCYAKDSDGIASVKCYYNVNGGSFTMVAMSAAPGDSLYSCVLPTQADQSQMKFYVEATDMYTIPATSRYPADAPAGAYGYMVGTVAISSIQYVDVGGDTSSYIGKSVNTTGIVTVSRGIYLENGYRRMFTIQDGAGAWNGIWVYDPTGTVPANEGDLVRVSGKIQEFQHRTEIYLYPDCFTTVSSGNPLPAPTVVTTNSIATTSLLAERYEGVLVKVQNVTVTNDSLDLNRDWQVNDGSGACQVGTQGSYFYTPNTGDHLDGVEGVLNYSGDAPTYASVYSFKIDPRRSSDILGPPVIANLVYSPHAPRTGNAITFSATVTGVHPPFSVKLFCSTNGGASYDSTNMTTSDSVYTAVKGPWPDGTTVDYYVRVTDAQPVVSRKPYAGSYDLYVGLLTIHQVQYVAPGGDSSSYAGKPVNLQGVVTVATGELGVNYFYIQNHYGAAPDFKGIEIYDRTGTVSVARGDSITVSGDVQEYYMNTEVAMFFPTALTVHSHGNNVPAPFPVTSASVAVSEKYEGVLVQVSGATVKTAKDQYGEWNISNGGAADTCKVGDFGTYAYIPVVGDAVNVTGVVAYDYNQYKIEPRSNDDLCYPAKSDVDTPGKAAKLVMMVHPNPMPDGGEVRFVLPSAGNTELKIYDVKGELVKTLVEGTKPAGEYTIGWNGTNGRGDRVTAGIYFLRLRTRAGSAVTKVVVSR